MRTMACKICDPQRELSVNVALLAVNGKKRQKKKTKNVLHLLDNTITSNDRGVSKNIYAAILTSNRKTLNS